MTKYKVMITGNIYVTTDSEEKAIQHAENKVNELHKLYNMSIFSISEVQEVE